MVPQIPLKKVQSSGFFYSREGAAGGARGDRWPQTSRCHQGAEEDGASVDPGFSECSEEVPASL